MWVLALFGAHWYLSLFTQSFFHHRYAAHRMFTMNKGWEKFFYVLSFIFQGASYLSPRAYGIMHRMHHAYADTEMDPHSPKYDHNVFAMMWRTRNFYADLFKGNKTAEATFTKDLPDWDSFDRFASNPWVRLIWVAIYVVLYVVLGAPWWLFPLIIVHAIMGPFHGVIINWFAHTIGYINFKMKDTSRNLFPVDLIMLGEGLHNNHHKHGGRANFAFKKYEFDPIYPIIKVLDLTKVIRIRKATTVIEEPTPESAVYQVAD
ncbi:MAG: acyl-CoA desaturase [Bacteroidota bacterium]|nr:acyl-CoA desaturase [Bacteroidota bacterium]